MVYYIILMYTEIILGLVILVNSVYFSICSLLFLVVFVVVYFSKQRMKLPENKVYSILLIFTIVGTLIDIVGFFCFQVCSLDSFFVLIITRFNMLYYYLWIFILMIYVIIVSYKSKVTDLGKFLKFLKIVSFLFFLITFVMNFLLPIHLEYNSNEIYPYGVCVNLAYFLSACEILIMVLCIIFNINEIKKKEYIPLFVFLFIGSVAIFIQKLNPAIHLLLTCESVVTALMYFTIENPDVKMIGELQVAREQADKANRAKTDFLSSMSHEIRTPLNAIVGFSDCIMEAETLGEAKENAHDIVNASQTLLEIVNGILDISKIEAGKIEIVNSKYNAFETFNELAKLITPKMREKGLDFSFNIAADLPNTLYGDHANLKKVVTNLLSNACKYTDRGFVHYEVNCVNSKGVSKLIISVEDSGRGIKKENIDKMFTKFQRLDEDRNTTIEGTGLGLAITKQLIELMGGRIIVHTVYGEGSKFTVIVNQRIEKPDLKDTKKVKTTLDLHDVRILLVDDTALNLKVACKLLERYDANQVITCDNGFDCLEKIRRGEVYDLILLDDMMPKMSGVETLKKLKEIPGFKVPTIALTANAISGMREKYLADGFDDYLAKPIEKDQLIQVINQVLGRSVTEELSVIPNEEINKLPISSEAVREEIIPVDEMQEDRNAVIPITDEDIDVTTELDKSKLEEVKLEAEEVKIDHIEDIETLEETSPVEEVSEVKPIDLVPVVDIDIPTESFEKVGRDYLESHGCDVNHALELLGDMEMYNMTINDFMSEVEAKWEKIVTYKNSGDMENYAIEVHSLKSDCKYLGFMTLAGIAYEHELKSKESDVSFVNDNFERLETEYKKVLEVARTYVEANPVSE